MSYRLGCLSPMWFTDMIDEHHDSCYATKPVEYLVSWL